MATVDANGAVAELRKAQAQSFPEDLGGGVILEMVSIPGGTFIMGSPESELNRGLDEGPQRQVTIPTFYMSKFQITQIVWYAVAKLPKVHYSLTPNPSQFQGDNLPVEHVSWVEAFEFCARLSQITGRLYRLPSEAEWEYACRAGTTTPFHFGETITPELANYDGSSPHKAESEGFFRRKTTEVGSTGYANAFGLFDMHGNVWEWCADLWHRNYRWAPVDGSAWQTDEDSPRRILRGGAFSFVDYTCRSAQRYNAIPI